METPNVKRKVCGEGTETSQYQAKRTNQREKPWVVASESGEADEYIERRVSLMEEPRTTLEGLYASFVMESEQVPRGKDGKSYSIEPLEAQHVRVCDRVPFASWSCESFRRALSRSEGSGGVMKVCMVL